MIGGWQLSGLLNLTSGRPFTVYSGANTLTILCRGRQIAIIAPVTLGKLVRESGTNFWFDTATRALFSTPGPGEFSNVGRNYFIGPKQYQLDLALSKKFWITERMNFDLRVEATNVTNTPNFAIPNQVLNSSTAPFGRIRQSVQNDARRGFKLLGNLIFN